MNLASSASDKKISLSISVVTDRFYTFIGFFYFFAQLAKNLQKGVFPQYSYRIDYLLFVLPLRQIKQTETTELSRKYGTKSFA